MSLDAFFANAHWFWAVALVMCGARWVLVRIGWIPEEEEEHK